MLWVSPALGLKGGKSIKAGIFKNKKRGYDYMAYFNWGEKYSVKVKAIDSQHQRLIDLINALYDAMSQGKGKEVVGKVLPELVDYTKKHFAAEERLMTTHGYEKYGAHKQEHDKFTKTVTDFNRDYMAGKASLSIQITNFLKSWLSDHILGTDKQYVPFFAGKGVS